VPPGDGKNYPNRIQEIPKVPDLIVGVPVMNLPKDVITEDLCCNICYERTREQNPIVGKIYRAVGNPDLDLCEKHFLENGTEKLFNTDGKTWSDFKMYEKGEFVKIESKPIEKIVIEKPIPVILPVKIEFEEQLHLLGEMGFVNKEKNMELLKKYNGDLQSCVKDLILM
jgi:hypothetical protein